MGLREPNHEEKVLIANYMEQHYGLGKEEAWESVESSHIAVFPNYISDGPGYAGKVFACIGGEPQWNVTLIEDGDKLIEAKEGE